jgi:cAMP-dependent protein kinase regulator
MLNYIKRNYGERPGVNEGERQELAFLTKECEKYKDRFKNEAKDKTKSTHSKDDSSGSGSESEGEVAELPVKMMAAPKERPRQSVSAEVFGRFNVEKEYVPPIYAKSEEQNEAIKNRMKNNFMFANLNPKDSKAIL